MESTQCVGVVAQPGTDAYGLVRPMSHVLDQQHYACEPNVYKTECIGRPRCSLWWPKYPDPLTFAGRVGGKIKRTNRFRLVLTQSSVTLSVRHGESFLSLNQSWRSDRQLMNDDPRSG